MEVAIKVTCRKRTDFPRQNKIDIVCHFIEQSNLYIFLGKSRIDGFPIYKPKVEYLRLGKIQKLKNIVPNICDRYTEIIELLENDIDIIREEKILKVNIL